MTREGAENKLFGYEFWALCTASLLCYCNLAIFYGFYNYLAYLDIPSVWRGPLLALEPLTALALRPFLSTRLTFKNSIPAMRLGVGLVVLALAAYPFAASIQFLALVRVLHGAGYVLLASALLTAFTHLIPGDRVAQGFGILSLTSLLPTAFMPPLVEAITPALPSPGWAYTMAAPLMLLVLPLLVPLGGKARARAAAEQPEHCTRPNWTEVFCNLRQPGVLGLILGQFFLLTGHTIIYYFMKSWSLHLGAGNPGLFFTCTSLATIAVRTLGMNVLDRLNPGKTAALALLFLAAVSPCFAQADSFALPSLFGLGGAETTLLCLALLYGLALGLGMPLLNAAMYRVSAPRLRSANMNLLMLALDAGFILGPILGGWALAAGWGLPSLFVISGGLLLLAGLAVLPVGRVTPAIPAER